ncbi:hypothetical protein [Paenibacillus sanguinis]|uniref:hypothetical protein n=1 Tax=Paenibacillus sanguinis TaxID=225906 RepID=UPI0003AA55E2|nr:hypothetical protein [Paenibacillus sanguinis]
MRKHCHCGQMMNLGFRTVIFEGIYEIDNVPIYECEECSHYQVLPEVKADVTDLLAGLKEEGVKEWVDFAEQNELAGLILALSDRWTGAEEASFESVLERQCEEQINLLLDLYGGAKNIGDLEWMDDISKRLQPLSKFVKNIKISSTN